MNNKFLLFGKILRLLRLRSSKQDGIYVSYSHEIKDKDIESYEKVLLHIRQTHTYITPEQFFEYLNTNEMPAKKSILMTFDDGFLSSYHAAKNILNKYNIKAIFFIPTQILELKTDEEMEAFTKKNIYFNTIEDKKLGPDEYRYMTREQMLDLVNDGHMIAPHTFSHIWIKEIKEQQAVQRELIKPREEIENLIGKKMPIFAFPVGTERQVSKFAYMNICKEYDYCFTALTGINTFGGNKHKLHRFNLPSEATVDYVNMALDGVYNSYYKYKMRKLSKITG